MCGRYTFTKEGKELYERFDIQTVPKELKRNYNVAPGQLMPVITSTNGKNVLEIMKWGLVPVWAKDPNIGYKLINARSETLFDKPMWRNVIRKKRCLILADGFYEWKKVPDGKKVQKHPYFIHPKNEALFSFAGVWDAWIDVEGLEWKTYSIITTEPNKEMRSVHDRMPVILHREDEKGWLQAEADDRSAIEALLKPYEDGALEMFEVSTDVNVTKNNDEHLVYPLNSA